MLHQRLFNVATIAGLTRRSGLTYRASLTCLAGLICFSLAGCSSGGDTSGSGTGFQLPDINIGGLNVGGGIREGVNVAKAATTANEVLTPEVQYHIGQGAAAQLVDKYGVYENQSANRYVNLIGHSLAQFSTRPEVFNGYHFQILDTAEINAFATPGSTIFVTRGMLKLCASEDELAAVLAHEIAHIQGEHAMQMIKESRGADFWKTLGMAAITIGTDGAAKQIAKFVGPMIGDTFQTLTVSGYSRDLERNADIEGTRILTKTGYDATAMVSLLEKMDKALASGKGFGSTHPHTSERIMLVKKEVGNAKPQPVNAARQARFTGALQAARGI